MNIKSVAQDYSSSAATSAERALAVQSIETMLEELLQLANTKYIGRYIFGGRNTLDNPNTGEKPFNETEDADGYITAVTRNSAGIDDLINREMREDTEIPVNIGGSAVFMPNGEGASGDIFQVVMDLRDALGNNDFAAVESSLSDIKDAVDQVVEQDVIVGARLQRLELINDQLDQMNTSNKEQRSHIEDVDYADLMIKYNTAQTILQTTLQTSATLLQVSLMNFV